MNSFINNDNKRAQEEYLNLIYEEVEKLSKLKIEALKGEGELQGKTKSIIEKIRNERD